MRRCFAALAAALVLLPLLAAPTAALEPDGARLYEGIDVSVYQGEIDFRQVREAGIEMVYIRAGFGCTADDRFEENARAAREAGISYGFYFYVTARTEEQAEEQARFFAELIRDKDYACRPAMDFEEFSGLSGASAERIGLAFLRELEVQTGFRPALYADAYAAERIWSPGFGAYPLWAAEYGPGEPRVAGDTWSGWAGFQYTDQGRVAGILVNVDRDRFTDRMLISEEEDAGWSTYTVRRGDTLWAIARRYEAAVAELAEINGIQNPDLIHPGQVLRVPRPAVPAGILYVVRPGDTLWAIARRYHTTVSALAEDNHIRNPALIYPGRVLQIRLQG